MSGRSGPPSAEPSPPMRQAAAGLAQAALERVEDPQTRRVRVEDYLTVLAAMTGEAAIVASGIDIEAAEMAPGSGLFGDVINERLTGDTADLAAVPADTVLGVLLAELVPGVVDRAAFGSIDALYRRVAAGVGSTPWGAVPLEIPEDNRPTVLPIQVAFELRPAVDAAMAALHAAPAERHVLCALALAEAIRQTRGAIAPTVGLQLALQVVFGTAKMMPMSIRAFRAAQSEDGR